MKKHWKITLLLTLAAAFAAVWLGLWYSISRKMDRLTYREQLRSFAFEDAYYITVEADVIAAYLGTDAPDALSALAGEQLGTVELPTNEGLAALEIYACAGAEGERHGLVAVSRPDGWVCYEMAGYASLTADSTAAEVCAAYGICSGADIAGVDVCDADGQLVYSITEAEEKQRFYEEIAALGENLPSAEIAKAYAESCGLEGVTLEDGRLQFDSDETEDAALEVWGKGTRLVTVRLENGLRLRSCIYAPVPGLFSLYGTYRLTSDFLADKQS